MENLTEDIQEIKEKASAEINKEPITVAHKSTAVGRSVRVEEVAELLLKQKSNAEIKKIIAQKYGISEETVRNDLFDANKLIQENIPEIKSIIAKNIETYRRIAEQAEGDDRRTAVLALQAMEKLLRLHNPELQVNNNTLNVNVDGIDTEDLMDIIKNAK